MYKILIFAGTTEGRMLAEFCAAHQIPADVSSATEYGAQLLPKEVGLLSGRLRAEEITTLLQSGTYQYVIDATHPYAEHITHTLQAVSADCGVPYIRLLREAVPIFGESVSSLEEMTALLNQNDALILSTLGSKSVNALTGVRHFQERICIRILPSEETALYCRQLGYRHIIQEKGPFSADDNIRHIRDFGAEILLTKESGEIGGYTQKAEAAKRTGIRMITLCRPAETGCSYDEIIRMLMHLQEKTT